MQAEAGQSTGKLTRGERVSLERALGVALGAARALAAAHRGGAVHGRLTPDSLKVDGDDVQVLGLEGVGRRKTLNEDPTLAVLEELAQSRPNVRKADTLLGALEYTSPEQVQGLVADARSDVYALGALLYELLTGSKPFSAPSRSELIRAILTSELVPPSTLRPEVPREVDELVLRAMARQREDRFANAGELTAALEPLLVKPPSVRQAPLVQEVTPSEVRRVLVAVRGMERRRALLTAAAAAGVVLVLGSLAFVAGPWRAPQVDEHTIVVLPMDVRGQTDGRDYLGRAFAEALAVNLALGSDLRVLPVPQTVELDAKDSLVGRGLAERLGAGRMVTGSLTRSGDKLQASVSLIATADSRLLWGTRLESADGDLPALASALVRELARQLGVTLPVLYDYVPNLAGGPAMASSADTGAALAALRSGNMPTALAATAKLIAAFPEERDAKALRAHALLLAWDADPSPDNRRQLDEALGALEAVDAGGPYVTFYRAYVLHAAGKPGEAVQRLSELLRRDDLSPQARAWFLRYRAAALQLENEPASALSDLEEALRIDPANAWTVAIYSDALRQQQRFAESLERARQAVALMPSYWRHHAMLGTALLDLKRYEEARDAFDVGCRMSSAQVVCSMHAVALLRAGASEGSREAATRAGKLTDTSYGTYNLACYWALAGERAVAMRYLRRAVELGLAMGGVEQDEDLASLRGEPEFRQLAASIQARRKAAPGSVR